MAQRARGVLGQVEVIGFRVLGSIMPSDEHLLGDGPQTWWETSWGVHHGVGVNKITMRMKRSRGWGRFL